MMLLCCSESSWYSHTFMLALCHALSNDVLAIFSAGTLFLSSDEKVLLRIRDDDDDDYYENDDVVIASDRRIGDAEDEHRRVDDYLDIDISRKHYIVGAWQQWSKKINEISVAVLVMNNANSPRTVTVEFANVPSLSASASNQFKVRDLWAHADIGIFERSWEVTLESHDSAFILLTVA
jgi:hypothetical protein